MIMININDSPSHINVDNDDVFFQKPYRIILGPPKHVLHLVWSVLGIYTAIITALKVAFYDFFDGPPAPLTQGQAFPSFV